jgi:hypothetical protein
MWRCGASVLLANPLIGRILKMARLGSLRVALTSRQATLLALCLLSFLPSCWGKRGNMKRYDQALQSGFETIPYTKQFSTLFPDSNNFISYYTGEYGTPTWNSKVGLYGRYVLQLQITITLNEPRSKIGGYGEPEFFLKEVERISINSDGRAVILYGPTQKRFGKKEWKKIVENKGDLSALGIPIVQDSPTPGFEEHWNES